MKIITLIAEQVWDMAFDSDSNVVDVHIRRLREKLEADPADPKLIVTSSGVGYMLVCPDRKTSA